MDFSSIVSEDKIKQAIKDGEFEGLPGMGKPLKKTMPPMFQSISAWLTE